MAKEKTLEDLFHDTLKDIYYAERKILKALPKMARAASSPDLKAAFEKHKDETEGHVERLQQVFELMGKRAQGKTCDAIDGIISGGRGDHREFKGTPAMDAGLISAAQAVEHYEITRYGTLKRWAEVLGHERRRQAARTDARRRVHDRRGADRTGGRIRQRDGQGRLITQQPPGTAAVAVSFQHSYFRQETIMGRGILLWLLGIPIPIIILLMLFMR